MSLLDTVPEELLQTILANVINPTSPHSKKPLRLVSRRFLRISTPLYFYTIHLRSQAQLDSLFVSALRHNPDLASHIRKIVIEGVWTEAGALFKLCHQFGSLKILDMTIDPPPPSDELVKFWLSHLGMGPADNVRVDITGSSSDGEDFCKHLHELTSITHLTVRKSSHVHLTQTKAQSVLSQLATAVKAWKDLEYVNLAFTLSDDPGSTIAPPGFSLPASPPAVLSHLSQVLSTLPNLRTFATRLPDTWNENILRVSRNPVLERIAIEDSSSPTGHGYEHAYSFGTHGRGQFFNEAKKHPRLYALIRAGTAIDSFGSPQHPYSSTHAPTTPLFTPPPPGSQTTTSQTYVFSCDRIIAQSQQFQNHNRPRPWSLMSLLNQSSSTPSQHPNHLPLSSSWSRPIYTSSSTIQSSSAPSQHHSFSSPSGSRSRPVPSLGPGPGTLAGKISDPISVSTSLTYTPGSGPLPTSNRRKRTLLGRERGENKSLDYSLMLLVLFLLLFIFSCLWARAGKAEVGETGWQPSSR